MSKPEHETIVKRASRRHDEEAHGGAWKVAFADFVLALMCLFMVLWVLAARDKEELSGLMTASGGHVVNGSGADPDIIVASAKAYLSALNRLHHGSDRIAAQG